MSKRNEKAHVWKPEDFYWVETSEQFDGWNWVTNVILFENPHAIHNYGNGRDKDSVTVRCVKKNERIKHGWSHCERRVQRAVERYNRIARELSERVAKHSRKG